MTYTIDDYKKVCYAAGELSKAIEALQEAQFDITNGGDWSNFGKCLDAVFEANKRYNKVNNDCAIEAYERENKLPKEFNFKSNVNPIGLIYHAVEKEHCYTVTVDDGSVWNFDKAEIANRIHKGDYVIVEEAIK